ncbi:conserved hypothetical protein, secreted [Candidatus Magnetomorum sp. HK-1]|nr:conserved hypothetical protein, secreted [Candidatus Magnetomorum sp. HK-1]
MMNRHKSKCLLLLCIFIMLYGCVAVNHPKRIKDGKPYCITSGLFLHQWDDHYERALSCIEGEFYDDAIADLKIAISMRDIDERMAETYGMHFIDYFPHRELGIIYLIKGKLQDAMTELQRSIEQEPSAKATYYLDKALIEQMKQQMVQVKKPELQLHNVDKNVLWTSADPVVISGSSSDDQYIKDIQISGQSILIERSKQSVQFHETVELPEGEYPFNIKAINLLDGETAKNIYVHVDRSGPVIIIDQYIPNQLIKGTINDTSGEVSLFINGKSVLQSQKTPIDFHYQLNGNKAEVHAIDRLNNQTKALISREVFSRFKQKVLHAFQSPLTISDSMQITSMKTTKNPQFIIFDWPNKHYDVFLDSIHLTGYVSADKRIVSASINNKSICSNPGRFIFFNQQVSLSKGDNYIQLSAIDELGRKEHKEIQITKCIPEILKQGYRFSSIQNQFKSIRAQNKTSVDFQYDLFHQVQTRKRLKLIVCQKLNRLFEDYLYTSVHFETTNVVQSSLFGTIYKDIHGLDITVRLVGNNRCILTVGDAFRETITHETIESMSHEISNKIHKHIPVIKGTIRSVEDQKIIAEFDQQFNPPENWPLIIYRLMNPDSKSGSDTQIIGYAKIEKRIRPGQYSCKQTKNTTNVPIKKGDKVVTQ